MRTAAAPREADALEVRYQNAHTFAKVNCLEQELVCFEAAASSSKAVMNRSLSSLCGWINGDSPLFLSFHKQVEELGRDPSDNGWDNQREAAESAINPYCYKELNFVALKLDGAGIVYYGPYSVTLKTETIEHRASVFEQNPFVFLQLHHVVAGRAPPFGYRATWHERGKLAVAKLYTSIKPAMKEEAFTTLLMEDRRSASNCDFLEVHIFGPINREGIERIVGPKPTSRADKALLAQAMRKAAAIGVQVEISD